MIEPIITIVDDDDAVRDSLQLLLNFRGFRCRGFASAESCLAAWSPNWRGCLLLDLRMGGMDGLSLQQALHERGSRLPVVFLSGHGNIAHARAALKAGAVDFLEKPYSEEALLEAIREAVARDARQLARHAWNEEIAARMARLSERERQVMELAVAGKANREIAAQLGISPRTVEVFKARMMEKMQARSLPELVRICLDNSAPGDSSAG